MVEKNYTPKEKISQLIKSAYSPVRHAITNLLCNRQKPRVIQMPITGRCNSCCVTCNVWKHKGSEVVDISPEKLIEILKNDFFSEVTTVGLNGGEFTLDKSTLDVIDVVLTLPKINAIYMISNGLYTSKLLEYMEQAHDKCKIKNVFLGLTLSIDGIGAVQNQVRGVKLAWNKTIESLNSILSDKKKYCDWLGIGCTISKYNVAYLPQMEIYFSGYDVPIEYHLAVPNKRIGTFEDADYSVLATEESRMLAQEFFFKKMNDNEPIKALIRYYIQFMYLKNHGKGRLATCDYLKRDITIDENLKMYLCATASDEIGDLNIETPRSIFRSQKYKTAYKEVRRCCNTCIHYTATPTLRGWFSYLFYRLRGRFVIDSYKLHLKW